MIHGEVEMREIGLQRSQKDGERGSQMDHVKGMAPAGKARSLSQ